MSKEKRFVIQVDPLEIEDDAIFDNRELRLYECQSDIMSDICSLLNKQDQQIADLEAKLAERDKTIDEINKEFLSVIKDWKQLVEIEKAEKAHLKQQLEESEEDKKALICDYESRITKEQELMSWLEHNNEELKQQLAEKEEQYVQSLIKLEKEYDEQLEKQAKIHYRHLKEKDQDKISFAVEQLEKVKELAHNHIKEIANDLSAEEDERLNQKHTIHGLATAITDIDNQIQQLTH